MQDVTTAAVEARLSRGNVAMAKLIAATGTDDVPDRNVAPLRSDLADATRGLQGRSYPPPPDRPVRSITDLAASLPPPAPAEAPRPARRDLTDLWEGDRA